MFSSWSPDGEFIAASNAMNGPIFVGAVIERQGFTSDISFVGHENTIQVAVCQATRLRRTSFTYALVDLLVIGIQPTRLFPLGPEEGQVDGIDNGRFGG